MSKIKIRKYLKKPKGKLARLGLSLVLAFICILLYFVFKDPIIEQIPHESKEYSMDYSLTNTQESTQVKGTTDAAHSIRVNTINYKARVFDLYFKSQGSPLYGHGQDFIDACERYGAPSDCTLLPAIAKVETDLCKTDISASQFNCWGYGGSGENRIKYKNFKEAIDKITGRLMQGYGTRFFNDPEAGELFYCGGHCNMWGDRVKAVQRDLKQFAKTQGYEL